MRGYFEVTRANSIDTFLDKGKQYSHDFYSIPDFLSSMDQALTAACEILKSTKQSDSSIRDIKRYILKNLENDISRTAIAAEFHLNPDYLSTLYKTKTGMTISEYITRERLKLAKKLLLSTDYPISEVSTRCGFQNISYFSKTFRKYELKTPLEYRQLHSTEIYSNSTK